MKVTEADRKLEKETWNKDRAMFNLMYPAEDVVKFLKRNYKQPEDKTILDFGCGSGRNTVLMSDMGFEKIIAMDYNEDCLKLTKEKLLGKNNVEYIKNERLTISLPDESVDCIVAWGALYFFTGEERKQFAKELYRVLKPNGMVVTDFRGKEDAMYGQGKLVENDMFLLDERAGHMKNFIYWFSNDDDLRKLFEETPFSIENMERNLQWSNNMQTKVDHYITWLRK